MTLNAETVWKERLVEIDPSIDSIELPDTRALSQDEEWCVVTVAGREQRIRFHDYAAIYAIPGLYERLFYDRLECSSPNRVSGLLGDVLRERGHRIDELRVLDLGAGNGMVGDELRRLGVGSIAGVDILPEAREAALRDRSDVYRDYWVSDLTKLDDDVRTEMASRRFNCLTTVATLGFGDIPPKAFATALSLVATPGWVAFNIKEDFLYEKDDSGFAKLVRELSRREVLRIEAYRRYQHRLAADGRALHYVAIVASKHKRIPPLAECSPL